MKNAVVAHRLSVAIARDREFDVEKAVRDHPREQFKGVDGAGIAGKRRHFEQRLFDGAAQQFAALDRGNLFLAERAPDDQPHAPIVDHQALDAAGRQGESARRKVPGEPIVARRRAKRGDVEDANKVAVVRRIFETPRGVAQQRHAASSAKSESWLRFVHPVRKGEATKLLQRVEIVGGGFRLAGRHVETHKAARRRQHFQDGLKGGEKLRIVRQARVVQHGERSVECSGPPTMRRMVDGVDHRARSVGGTKSAFRGAGGAVPQLDVGALLFAKPADKLPIEVSADGASEAKAFVVAEDGSLEGVPCEHEP